MANKTGNAASKTAQVAVEELTTALGEARKQLTAEVKVRRDVIKPMEVALRALKDPHRNALALYEAAVALENPNGDFILPKSYATTAAELRAFADEQLSELEFTFARDLREAFKEKGVDLTGPPTKLVADLFVIEPDLRKKQVYITFSRQSVTAKKIKLDVVQVLSTYERARREICERKIDLDALLAELFEAYQRLLTLSGKKPGARLSIVDCYRELVLIRQPLAFRKNPSKNSFTDYPKTHFAYDMLELRRQRKLNHQGQQLNFSVATIDVGSDSTRAMFLATSATEGQFIKELYFAQEKSS
ncbi:MAG: hypothetical protein AB1757_05435 [Acidobacteriota bacterium]